MFFHNDLANVFSVELIRHYAVVLIAKAVQIERENCDLKRLRADYKEHFKVVRRKIGKRKELMKSSRAEGKRDRTRTTKKRKAV